MSYISKTTVYNKEAGCVDTQLWSHERRQERKFIAMCLSSLGERLKLQLLKANDLNRYYNTPVSDLKSLARSGGLPHPLAEQILELPHGLRRTDVVTKGFYSSSVEPVYEYEDHPLTQARTGRRARLAKEIAGMTGDFRYVVVTSPSLCKLSGDLNGAIDEHFEQLRRVIKVAEKSGYKFTLRTAEFVVSEDGVHVHSNLLFESGENDCSREIDPHESIAHAINVAAGAVCESKAVYDIEMLGIYCCKSPVSFSSKKKQEIESGLGLLDEELLDEVKSFPWRETNISMESGSEAIARHLTDRVVTLKIIQPDVLLWLYNALRGRRLIVKGGQLGGAACLSIAEGERKEETANENDSKKRRTACLNANQERTTDQNLQNETHVVNAVKVENEILKLGASRITDAGVNEPVIFIRNYTKQPTTKAGIENLAKIDEARRRYLTDMRLDGSDYAGPVSREQVKIYWEAAQDLIEDVGFYDKSKIDSDGKKVYGLKTRVLNVLRKNKDWGFSLSSENMCSVHAYSGVAIHIKCLYRELLADFVEGLDTYLDY